MGPVEVTVRGEKFMISIIKSITFKLGSLKPNITLLSLTTTSVNVSWTQPPLSFTPVDYTVTLAQGTGSDAVLCNAVENRGPIVTAAQSMVFTSLEDFSAYRVTVTARFMEFGSSPRRSRSINFITLSSGTQC